MSYMSMAMEPRHVVCCVVHPAVLSHIFVRAAAAHHTIHTIPWKCRPVGVGLPAQLGGAGAVLVHGLHREQARAGWVGPMVHQPHSFACFITAALRLMTRGVAEVAPD